MPEDKASSTASAGGLAPSFERCVPDGDNRKREVCRHCGFIHYVNPKIVVGSVVEHEGRYLLCRRAIEPRAGFWTLPAGFLEVGETLEEGACREAEEEACAALDIERLLAVYSIPRISQVQIFFAARLARPDIAPGPESREVALFGWEEIPWHEIAFPTVHWALHAHRADHMSGTPRLHTTPPADWDPAAYGFPTTSR
ncbi:MAG: NUDIX domain-containing protein [Alphaproteobacteria bacterium]|nr:MAG: NUDIX domain-containing protein [Alphaproteobacteria bacterium]